MTLLDLGIFLTQCTVWVVLCELVCSTRYQQGRRNPTFLTCTHTLLVFCWFYWGIRLLNNSEVLPAPHAVSQTSAARFLSVWQAKEVEWKNCSPAHCGHMAREESSRSGARRPQSGIFVVSFLHGCSLRHSAAWPASPLCCFSPHCFFFCLSHTSI